MGKKTVTGSSTLIITADTEVNYLRKTINTGIMQGASIGSHINLSYRDGMGISLKQFFRYGRDHFVNGLPSTNITAASITAEHIEKAIKSTHGEGTWIIQSFFGALTNDYWIEDYLVYHYGYDSFFQAMQNPPKGVDKDAEINHETISPNEVRLIFKNADGTEHTFEVTLRIPQGIKLGEDYCSAQYRMQISKETGAPRVTVREYQSGDEDKTTIRTNTEEVDGILTNIESTIKMEVDYELKQTTITEVDEITKYTPVRIFVYKPGSGIYPEIDKEYSSTVKTATTLPIIPLRVNHTDLTTKSKENTELYKTSNALMKKLGLKMDHIGKELRKNNLGDVNHIFLHIGVPISTKQKDSIKYIHAFFRDIARATPNAEREVRTCLYSPYPRKVQYCDNDPYTVMLYRKPTTYSMYIRSGKFNITFNHYGASHHIKKGVIGKVGSYTKTRGTRRELLYYYWIYNKWYKSGDWCEGKVYSKTYTYDEVITRRQINEDYYEEVTVYSFNQFNNVHQGHGQWTSAYSQVNRNTLDTPILIPVDMDLLRRVGLVTATQMTTECIGLTLNSYKVIKKKWYQKGIFKVVMAVIAIVIAVYGGSAFSASIMSAYSAGGISAAMLVAAETIAVSVAISFGVSFLTSKLAPELSLIIATIVTIAAIASLSLSSIGSVDGLPFAEEMLATVPAINKGVETKLQKMYADLQTEVELFGKYAKDKSAEVENAFKELAGNANIDVFQLIRATQLNLFETPNTFLSRTLNTEVSSLAISSVTDYVQNTLTLPKGLIS